MRVIFPKRGIPKDIHQITSFTNISRKQPPQSPGSITVRLGQS
jgi:hypothetical protein